jgi:hypothetical protein
MIVYVNGDSNSAGAEAVNSYCFAKDDPLYWALDRQPHPDNLRVSYGCELANMMGAILECDAESASSNDRIIRSTREYLETNNPDLVIIGWSTWEREEWWDAETNQYWQVNAGGAGSDWPDNIKDQYKDYIVNLDIHKAITNAYNKIWALHIDLQKQNINHLFFNCFEPLYNVPEPNWDSCYLEPYAQNLTYYNWLKEKGFKTVNPESYHFGADAHYAWAEFLYQTLVQKNLTT